MEKIQGLWKNKYQWSFDNKRTLTKTCLILSVTIRLTSEKGTGVVKASYIVKLDLKVSQISKKSFRYQDTTDCEPLNTLSVNALENVY